MKLLHLADLHLELGRYGTFDGRRNSRAEDLAASWHRMVDVAVDVAVDAVLIAGDTFHTRHPSPVGLRHFADGLAKLDDYEIPALIVTGNHDGNAIIADPGSSALGWAAALRPEQLWLTPAVRTIETRSGPLVVAGLPYPHRRSLDALTPGTTQDERHFQVTRAVEEIVEVLSAEAMDDSRNGKIPTVFLGHLSVAGAHLSEERTMQLDWDVVIRPDLLAAFSYAALGHIHRPQRVGPRAYYAGAPDYHDFGEEAIPRGGWLVDLDPGDPIVTFVPNVGTRPFNTVRYVEGESGGWTWADADGTLLAAGPFAGSIVHLIVQPRVAASSAAIREALGILRVAGASFVKQTIVKPEAVVAEAGPAAVALDPGAALDSWIVAGGYPLEPARTRGRELLARYGLI